MKKPILLTILACCLLFLGIKSATAATTYTNFTTPGSNGLVASPLSPGATQTNLIVYGLAIKNTNATAAYTSMRFDLTDGDNWNTDFSGNITLYVMTAAQYAGAGNSFSTAAATAMETIASPATANLTFNALTGSPNFAANTTYYYFITVNYTTAPTPAQTTTQIELNQTKGPANTTITETGANYTLNSGITFTAASTAGFATSPLSASFTAQPIFGVTMTNSSATAFTFGDFDFSTNGGYAPNTYFSNFKLYVNTTGNTFAGATLLTSTFNATNSATDMYPTFTSTIPANTSYSYFIVADYTYPAPATARTFQLSLDDAQPASFTPDYTQGLSLLSTNYAIPIPSPVTATAASLTTTIGSNGLSASTGIAAAANYTVYGMSLTPSATGTTKVLTGLTFTTSGTPAQTDNYFYGTAYLYASNNSSFDGTATQISTVTPVPASNTLSFTGFTVAQNITAGTTKYYYVVIVYSTGVAATATQTITYSSATSTATITPAAGVAGPTYTYNPIPVVTATAASLTTTASSNGLAAATISAPGSYAIYGMSLTPSATGISKPLTGLSFTVASTQNDNYFYGTAYLYASASPTFSTGTATQISSVATGANTTLNFTGFTTAQNITAGTTVYYYVYIVYAVPGVAATATQTISYSGYTSAAVVTPAAGVAGPTYTFNPIPYVTATAASLTTTVNTSGLANSPIGLAGNYAIYGMSVTPSATGVSTTLTGLTFTATSTQNNNYFYATAYLYSSANSSYDGTAVKISTVTTGASKTLAFTGFTTTQTLTAGAAPTYYYIVIVYAAPGAAASNSSTLTYTSATSAATITPTPGMVDGPAYLFNPTPAVTATDVPAADLTNSTIYIGQTNIAVAGIGLTMNIGTTTLSQLTFSFTPTSTATAAQYFTNVRVVSSTSALTSPFNYASVTPVTGASIAITTGVITATIPAVTVNTTTTYYYLVVDYTVTPEAAARTFTFNPTSYTTALTGKVSPTYTANTFYCTTPTYYWTGAAGDNNWTTPNNWEVTTTAPILVNGYYPGQLVNVDNVVISPVQTTPTINLTATKTVANLTNSAGIATALNIIGAGIKLNISNQLNVGSTTSGAAASSLTLGGLGNLDINNDAEINYNANLIVPTNGLITIDAGSTVNLNGGTGQVATITLSGGTIQSNNGDFEFNNSGAILTATAGTWNALANTTINLNGANNQIVNNGATINIFDTNNVNFYSATDNITNTSGTFNITNTTVNENYGTIVVNGGTMNVNSDAGGGSDIELGYNLFGIIGVNGTMTVNGGTLAVSGASLIHMAWNGSTLTNAGGLINVTTGSQIFADYAAFNNNSGTTNINASTVQLAVGGVSLTNGGTINFLASSLLEFTYQASTATNTGTFNTANTTVNFNSATCAINNTAGNFNFGTSSIMNLANTNDKVTNSSTGTFTCSPLTVINLSGGSNAGNAPVISNTSSNPFTLLSDSTGSATIGKITAIATNGSLQGSFNVQRYISTASRNYRLLASQVNKTQALPGTTAAPNVVDVSALGRTVTSPATYPGAYIAGPGAGFPNIIANPLLYLYQESLLPGSSENSTFTGGKNVGIINITNASPWTVSTQSTAAAGQTASDNSTTVKIPAGNGYLLYYIHDNTSTSVSSALNSCSTTATGFINQGQIPLVMWGTTPYTSSLTLTTTAGVLYPGVIMVGNPYPSSIDLNQLYTDNTGSGQIFTSGAGEAFYELDPTTEQFVSYNYNGTTGTTSGSDASRYIASGQGFYVTVVKNGKQLYFNEDQKIPSATVAAVTNVPGLVLEGVHVGGSGNTTDNVSLNNKTTNAVLLPRNVNPRAFASANNTATATNQAAKVSNKASSALASLLGTGATDTTKKKVKKYDTIPPHDTTITPPAPPKIAGMHLRLVMDSLTYDECGLYFNTGWSDKSDNNDAKDLDGTGGKVYLSSYSSDDVRTSINAMSDYAVAGGKRVKLFVKFSANGLYKLQLADIADFKSGTYSVFLLDKMLNDSLDLTLYKSYNFNYVAGTANDSTRFVLAIEHKPVPHYALLSFSGAKSTDGVLLDWKTVNDGASITYVLQKLAANNTYVFLDSLQSDSSGAYSYIDEHPSLGTNTYRLQQTDALGDITYSAPVTIGYNSTSPNGGLNIYPNPAKSMITVTLTTSSTVAQVATADIYNMSGTLVAHRSVNSNSFTHDVSSYQLGIYIIELKNTNGLLIGKSKFVKVQ
jgi:hypothetical protein